MTVDTESSREHRRETPEEHLESLLRESDCDIWDGRVSNAIRGLEEIRERYGL